MAREPRLLKREWLWAWDAFLSAALAHTNYLRANGRLSDQESARDIATLEEEHRRIRRRLRRLQTEAEESRPGLRVPQDPGRRLALAARRELRRYRDEVFADSRRLRARTAILVRRSHEVRRRQNGERSRFDPGRPFS